MKKTRRLLAIVLVSFLMQIINPSPAKSASLSNREQLIPKDVNTYIPMSIQITENAINVLSKGLNGMNPESQKLFTNIFDPGDTGDVDDEYLKTVIENYEKILMRLEGNLEIEYVEEHKLCTLMRLYYTNYMRIYVCPYYLQEENNDRKARVLVHEVAHIALMVVDRPYYDPKSYSASYNNLSTRGPWVSEIPVVGHIIREINHSDTLYHPDAYAWFASLVAEEVL